MAAYSRPEAMNVTTRHSKVGLSLVLAEPLVVAGSDVCGKMEMECRADKGLGLALITVELIAIQELTSRDHSATSTFLHSRTVFQGGKHGPSNAVFEYQEAGDPPLPQHYYQAKRGTSTFFFKLPIPYTSPSSINFAGGIATVRYEIKTTVQAFWKGKKETVVHSKSVDVVEAYETDFNRPDPQTTIVAENGKIYTHAKLVGDVIVAGESNCVEFHVKNHSNKRNNGITVSLNRTLYLPSANGKEAPLRLSDTLTTVPFRGGEYIIEPTVEGIAQLVFDVPMSARSIRGGSFIGEDRRLTESLFEVRATVSVKMTMGLGNKDIVVDIPVTIIHPAAMPFQPSPPLPMTDYPPYQYSPIASPHTPPQMYSPYMDPHAQPYYPHPAMSPPIAPYVNQDLVWLPPPAGHSPQPYQYFSPPIEGQPYYPPPLVPAAAIPRPSSAGGGSSVGAHGSPQRMLNIPGEAASGKGQVATRISNHLRQSSRNRSVSPMGARHHSAESASVPAVAGVLQPLASQPIPIAREPEAEVYRNLPAHAPPLNTNLSLSPASTGMVHSPRPVLSPKQSYAVDLRTQQSMTKSERVEDLEKMAEAVVSDMAGDLSGDVKALDTPAQAEVVLAEPVKAFATPPSESDVNKTLPGPPVPSGKVHSAVSSTRPRADVYFSEEKAASSGPLKPTLPVAKVPPGQTPPTPTLTAVVTRKESTGRLQLPRSKSGYLNGLGPTVKNSESGLDALERRLLMEVGTRKMDVEKRPDVRDIMGNFGATPEAEHDEAEADVSLGSKPIPIKTKSSELADSAISSLTLAGGEAMDAAAAAAANVDDAGSDGKTHRGRGSRSGDEVDVKHKAGPSSTKSGKTERDGEKRSKKRVKDKGKATKGRVAAWLGRIDPDAPPEESQISPSRSPSPVLDEDGTIRPRTKEERDADKAIKEEGLPKTTPAAPNPRSSGFVPANTFTRSTFRRTVATEEHPANPWSSIPIKDQPVPKAALQSIRTDRQVAPPSADPGTNPWASIKPSAIPPPRFKEPPQLKLPELVVKDGAKYDIRSARGGKGGKVTAIASIWASGGAEGNKKVGVDLNLAANADKKPNIVSPLAKPSTPATSASAPAKLKPTAAAAAKPSPPPPVKRPPNLIKSVSVPAMVSSSHAIPTLSSTASLARPTASRPPPPIAPKPVRVMPPVAEQATSLSKPTVTARAALKPTPSAPKAPEVKPTSSLAFGQARLRELIKKYQGPST